MTAIIGPSGCGKSTFLRSINRINDLIPNIRVEVEEECLKILALHQPVAIDLRFIVAVLKINNDLERIGDLAVNIAERSSFLAGQPQVHVAFDFGEMSEKTEAMLNKSLDALVNMSSSPAHEVCMSDDAIDDMNRQVYLRVQEAVLKHPRHITSLIHLLSVSRHLWASRDPEWDELHY